jgi:hypothetical protein
MISCRPIKITMEIWPHSWKWGRWLVLELGKLFGVGRGEEGGYLMLAVANTGENI